ncbi:MAG: DUF2007 domain-containing protein [Bacteroidia bacterium]|nr:DUF2007 domain-containing protein [Bacteroidia bacterium]
MENWKKVYSNQDAYRVEIVRAILTEHALDPVVIDKRDSAYGGAFDGESEIYVQSERFDQALQIIADEIRLE